MSIARSVDDLLALPYFDLLAELGEYSLHPGGLQSTARLLDFAGLRIGDRVLEVGCGTGMTTHALLAAQLSVTVAEPNVRMISAMRNTCLRAIGRLPEVLLTDAETLAGVDERSFQLVLFEAVFGFIRDRGQALLSARRALRPERGRLAIIDFHYHSVPPVQVREDVAGIVGHPIDVLTFADWEELLVDWRVAHQSVEPLAELARPNGVEVRRSVNRSGRAKRFEEFSVSDFERVAKRLRHFAEVFDTNRRHMNAHALLLEPKC